MMMNLQELDKKYYLPAFKRFPITLVRGEGSKVWDDEGNEYIDALAGIAVSCLGHNNPIIVNAIKNQADKIIHTSNFFLNETQALLSEKLVKLSGMDKVFFGNSGAEAVEGAVKLARKYVHSKRDGGDVISFTGCFHGRTIATIAMGKKKMQEGFGPMPAGFKQAEFNNLENVKAAADDKTAAIIIEPIQGEGGIVPADMEFLKDLRHFCTEKDIVLIFDEIQCGIGRTGYMFAKDFYGVQPDILTSAKALGGGVPISAILCSDKIASTINPGDHGTTFGGNPLAAAAALAVLNEIEKESFLEDIKEKGKWFVEQIKDRNPQSAGMKEIRGMGLMIGIEFEFETKQVVENMLKLGVLANATAETVLRIVPPLTISKDELKKVIDVIFKAAGVIKANA
jgi:acetylornithine/N-succinyldiaminopimelate aminotransferase